MEVTSVSDYRVDEGSLYFGTNPAKLGCNYGGINQVRMVFGAMSVTPEIVKTALGTAMAAMVANKKVTFHYDSNSAPLCHVQIISVGGVGGTCL